MSHPHTSRDENGRPAARSELRVVPAYGRDYKSKAAVVADWNDAKDFMICNHFDPDDGRYCNMDDARLCRAKRVTVRYARLQKVAVLTLDANGRASVPR